MKKNAGGKSRREFLKDAGLAGLGISFCGSAAGVFAQPPDAAGISGSTTVSSVRQRIPLDANWRFQKVDAAASNEMAPLRPEFDDQGMEAVGVPHCYNDLDSFQNAVASRTFQGKAWYRKLFHLDKAAEGKKVFLEFQGVNIGAAVYVNGKFKPGNTAVAQPQPVTHVGGFLPFVLDVTDDVNYGADNLLAVRVCNTSERPFVGQSFFKDPGFGTSIGFGMGFGGIHCPVNLHVTHRVHVPFDSYSPMQKWGTYAGAVSASDESAQIRIQTNVENEDAAARNATLSIRLLDENNQVVLTLEDATRTIKPGEITLFDQAATLGKPRLWYPNNSPYGKPHLYRLVREIRIDNSVVDRVESPLGIRMITWDDDYCYINGKKHLLNGFGHRNMYPALGSALPAEIQWNDVKPIADCGGNLLRVGHVPPFIQTVEACDACGVLVLMDSGDNEWSLKGEPALTYKKEYDRDMIIRYRNHPSVAAWESNNGLAKDPPEYSLKSTLDLVDQWDYIKPRIVGSRDKSDYFPTDRKILAGYTNKYEKVKGSPSMNWEVYFGNFNKDGSGKQLPSFTSARFDYADEKSIADHTITDYLDNLKNQACGWIAWMLAETQGEGYLTYLNGISNQKSLGSSALDGNRFPKLIYQIYKNALWVPFSIRPGVALQSHWNLSGVQDVDAWSNCPSVELFLNGISLGVRQPDEKKRCTWKEVAWQSGELKAVGRDAGGKPVCADLRQTAGAPHHIVLAAEPRLTRPSGEMFRLTANGSDAAIITARIVDANGTWCPLADNNIRFKVAGPGNYRGSYNFYVTPNKPVTYHAPGDPELQAEGGLMRVAVRSTFQPGTVQVTAESEGLGTGTTSFQTVPRI